MPWGVYLPSNIDPMATITGGLDGPQTATAAYVRTFTDVVSDSRVHRACLCVVWLYGLNA